MSEQDLPASPVRLLASSLRMLVSLGARIVEPMVVYKKMPECVIGGHNRRRCCRGGKQRRSAARSRAATSHLALLPLCTGDGKGAHLLVKAL